MKFIVYEVAKIRRALLNAVRIVFTALSVTSGVLLALEYERREALLPSGNTAHPTQMVIGFEFKVISIKAMLAIVFVVSVLASIFSVLLLIGIAKNRPGLLLSYFAFGIMTTIIMQLGCLLLMLQNFWYISLLWFGATLVYIHYLFVVHTVYEMMQRGKQIGLNRDEMHEELLN
ncbi:unnamed protein product, partial [Iphiclides podalirius]